MLGRIGALAVVAISPWLWLRKERGGQEGKKVKSRIF